MHCFNAIWVVSTYKKIRINVICKWVLDRLSVIEVSEIDFMISIIEFLMSILFNFWHVLNRKYLLNSKTAFHVCVIETFSLVRTLFFKLNIIIQRGDFCICHTVSAGLHYTLLNPQQSAKRQNLLTAPNA